MKKFACALALVSAALAAHAQQSPPPAPVSPQPPSPEQVKQLMQATMGAMVSVMGPMTEAVIQAQLNAAARPEAAEKLAAFKKNLYDALLKKGFDPQQALQIVIATSPPSAAPNAK